MRGTHYWLSLAGAALASAPAIADTTMTKSWFMDHHSTRSAVIEVCRDNPGTARNIPNCINAEEAAQSVYIRDKGPRVVNASDLCSLMPPAFQAVNNCSPVMRRK